MRKFVLALAGAGIVALAPVVAQSTDDFAEKVINAPLPASLQINGIDAPTVKVREIEGGKARRVAVPGADPQPWKIALQSATTQAVKKGDRLVIAFYARTHNMPAGAEVVLPTVQMQLNREPYSTVFGGQVTVKDQIEFHQVAGRADRDYAAGEIAANIHLATGRHTIDFGPLFIVNMDKPAAAAAAR